MCGRYFIEDFTEEEVQEYYDILDEIDRSIKSNKESKVKTRGEIFPSDIVPVIANNKEKIVRAFPMQWGYKPFQEGGQLLINARSETASEKATFKRSMRERRCLIPASSYFEWENQAGGKVKHAIQPIDKQFFFMAGLYRLESEKDIPVFTILTRDATPDIKFIHHRMPVILPKGARNDWLNLDYNADEVLQAALLDMEHRIA
ncbi:MAG: SOS response-associated peptidase [Candidatus Delongbacteria bacterium]|nr:SOS response-associated peptidase [Candidatus Delongbacteria bacterium]